MYVIYIISLCMMVISFVVLGSFDEGQGGQAKKSDIEAGQMVILHQAAEEYCRDNPASCSSAVRLANADLLPYVPGMASNGGSYSDEHQFASFSDGSGHVFTTMVVGMATTSQVGSTTWDNEEALLNGRTADIRRFLVTTTRQRYFAGPYDRASQTLAGSEGTSVTLPKDIDGWSIMDDAPTVASAW
ncbi:hypothetical protein [Salipiger mucosus]|uniref:hypothetical protein n=1 Tax=Salipiger mucosus TaxID=263378 RepID=UPI00037480B5|nr:hypothetical protein [Salipiger mucosus]